MDMKKLMGMRPQSESIADIEAALAAARAAGEAAARAEGDLMARRGDVLLMGAPDEVTRAEEALARARLDADRAATMVQALEAKLAATIRAQKLGELRQLVDEANRLAAAAASAISSRYEQLAAALVAEVLRPEAEALAAIAVAHKALERARFQNEFSLDLAELKARLPMAPLVTAWPAAPHHSQLDNLGKFTMLISPGAPIWPRADRAG